MNTRVSASSREGPATWSGIISFNVPRKGPNSVRTSPCSTSQCRTTPIDVELSSHQKRRTDMTSKIIAALVLAGALTAGSAHAQQLTDKLPTDPNVTIGKLPNGITYY